MYTVVTHTIKEEHFNHPTTAAQGIKMYCGNVLPTTTTWLSEVDGDVITCPPTDGNIKVKTPIDYEFYSNDVWGDVHVNGNMSVNYDLNVTGTISGRGSMSSVVRFAADLQGNSWPGQVGDLARTDSYMYLCTDPDTWIRWPIQTTW